MSGRLFSKILIANRGEIALRIISACEKLGIEPVVVYTEPDKNSLAVKKVRESYPLKSGDKWSSYMDMKLLIEIAKKCGAKAIHPGYGFLSENEEFVKVCEENNIKFIGPNYKIMSRIGNKAKVKTIVKSVGVPVILGIDEPIDSIEKVYDDILELGFPVILKACLGGGGKGLRIVNTKEELTEAFIESRREAEISFGNEQVYIEKLIINPRHIEFQILRDKFKNTIHLGERECTIQRRNQKLIEEAPSPSLNKILREKIADASVKIAEAFDYEGICSIEFLLDSNNDFYFMEVNPRIQVEHTITEMITGVDIVCEQIKIACGIELDIRQEDVTFNGCAIEFRINAESVYNDFMPSAGCITKYIEPKKDYVTISSNAFQGMIVSCYYDSMIAKLIIHANNRKKLIQQSKKALEEFEIHGIDTTIPFHKIVLEEDDFINGKLTTGFIEEHDIVNKTKIYLMKQKKNAGLKSKKKLALITAATRYYIDTYINNKTLKKDSRVPEWIMCVKNKDE